MVRSIPGTFRRCHLDCWKACGSVAAGWEKDQARPEEWFAANREVVNR